MGDLFFDDVSNAFRAGEITGDHIAGWLDVLGLDGEQREARWSNLHGGPGGTLVQFQVVALHRTAREEHFNQRAAGLLATSDPSPSPSTTPTTPVGPVATTDSGIAVPAPLLRDVPEPVYDEPLPNLAGAIKARLGIIAAVRMFGKTQDRIRDTFTEGVKVRCPYKDHNDSHPSAWVNTEKNTWFCGVCTVGGDVIDFFAARRHSLKPTDFHRSTRFSEVVKEMGAEMGLAVVRKGRSFVIEDEEAPLPSPLPDAPVGDVAPPARSVPTEADSPLPPPADVPVSEPVVPPSPEAAEPITVTVDDALRGITLDRDMLGDYEDDDDDDDGDVIGIPQVEWRDLPINPGSFLGEWMAYAETYYRWVPPEYFLFAGIQAIGLATGHNVTSFTGAKLTGSTLVALVGSSASGKSTAVNELKNMLRRVPGVKFDKDFGAGVKMIPSPASSEALLSSIFTDIEDLGHPVPGARREVGVTAWLYEDEFATFMERARRRGGGAMKTRLIGLHDFTKSTVEPELVMDEYALTSGSRSLHDTYFAAMFTTQTDAVRGLMERTDLISGFLNRIVPVMGARRERRTVAGSVATPLIPTHDAAYKCLWDNCRKGTKHIPFTEDALLLVDSHPFLHHIEKLSDVDSLYSRVQHMTVRLAMLLAVNNNEREVGPEYVSAVCDLFSTYLMACFRKLRSSVIATDMDDAAARIHAFVRFFYKKKGVWPTQRQWSKDRSYSDFDAATRQRSLDSLFGEFRLVRVKLTGRTGTGGQTLLIPEGEWVGYADSHDKKYAYTDFYAKATV